jgi:hypothetical protein
MIYQIANVKTKTEPLPNFSEGLFQARRIQAHVREQVADGLLPKNRWQARSPATASQSLVPANIWFD